MTFNSMDPMKSTSLMMGLIAKKQKVIGENIANTDTPGYTKKDLSFGQYLNGSSATLETKLIGKFGSSPISEEISGEKVNIANELMDLQKNSLLYSMATRNMSSIITQMKTVINVGK